MNRFKKYLICGVLSCSAAFMLAAAAEWDGYHIADQKSGANILCTFDPTCRRLVDDEIAVARTIFGDQIDYSVVKIFNRPHFGISLNKVFDWARGRMGVNAVPNVFGISPNGNVYIDRPAEYSADFSKSETGSVLFMHEMTHVWQMQRGMNLRRKAADALLQGDFNYDHMYDYNITAHDDFYDFNFEQQARIVENYIQDRRMIQAFSGKDESHRASYLRKPCESLIALENKLIQQLPLTPEPLCQPYRDAKPAPKRGQSAPR